MRFLSLFKLKKKKVIYLKSKEAIHLVVHSPDGASSVDQAEAKNQELHLRPLIGVQVGSQTLGPSPIAS